MIQVAALLSVTHCSIHTLSSVLTRLMLSLVERTMEFKSDLLFLRKLVLDWHLLNFSADVISFLVVFFLSVGAYIFCISDTQFISGVPTNNQFTDLSHIQLFIEQLDLLLELLHLHLPVRDFLSEVTFIQRRHIFVSLQIKLSQLVIRY